MRAQELISDNNAIRCIFFLVSTFCSLLLAPAAVQATHSATEPSDGTVRSFITEQPPRKIASFHFDDARGQPITLAKFRGKVLMVNLWATWCPPCVREMPALDRLQGKFKGTDFIVVPLSLDRGGIPVIESFYQKNGLRHLEVFSDSDQSAEVAFPVDVLPANFIVDQDGRVISFLRSFVDWDAPEAEAMIRRLISTPQIDK